MAARPRHRCLFGAGLGLVLFLAWQHLGAEVLAAPAVTRSGRPHATGERPEASRTARRTPPRSGPAADARPPAGSEVSPSPAPRGFLIYLIDRLEPIVVSRYTEESGEIRFEKYGGSVGIPKYEVFRIVPDEPDQAERAENLPSPSPTVEASPTSSPQQPELYVTMQGGGNLRASAVSPEGDRVRVSVPSGSFTVPRAEILGVIRIPPGSELPEAWISIATAGSPDEEASREEPSQTERAGPPARAEPDPAVSTAPRLPYAQSDRPHFLRIGSGQVMRIDGFWTEGGEVRFTRLGGVVGVAVSEILRLFPEEIAPVHGRTPVRFAQRIGSDLLEVRVRSGLQRVRLLGVTLVDGARPGENPWRQVERGTILYLEFDRQRYDPEGHWLAYVFLPNHRMLNAELIRVGLARPLADGRNIRYLDLFHELVRGELPDAATTASRAP